MVHFLFDTNVVLDFLMDRKPFSVHSAHLFTAADKGKLKAYVSAISFNNSYYVIEKSEGHKKAIYLIEQMESMFKTIDLTSLIINNAIKSGFSDFEDAIQFYSALSESKIQAIVTRNVKDFKSKDILILTPEQAIKYLLLK